MKCLLDTSVWLWSLTTLERLNDKARDLLSNGENEFYLSAASSSACCLTFAELSRWLPWPRTTTGGSSMGKGARCGSVCGAGGGIVGPKCCPATRKRASTLLPTPRVREFMDHLPLRFYTYCSTSSGPVKRQLGLDRRRGVSTDLSLA